MLNMTVGISGRLEESLYERIKWHPLRGDRTLSDWYAHIFQEWLDSPAIRMAVVEGEQKRIQENLDYLRARVDKPDSLDQAKESIADQIATASAVTEKEATPQQSLESSNGSHDEGYFIVSVLASSEDEDAFERIRAKFVLKVEEGPHAGMIFPDWVATNPETQRTDFVKFAFGLQQADKLSEHLGSLPGKRVLVRRVKGTVGPNGAPRMLRFYSRVPQR